MRRLATAALLSLAAAALWTVTPGVEADQPPSATGGWTNDVGQTTTLNAKQHPNGTVSGRWKSEANGVRVGGDVLCISVVGNKAYVSGTVTRFDPFPFPPFVGATFAMRVTDNGEGSGAEADSTTAVLFFLGPVPCDNPGFQAFLDSAAPERTVLTGNIQVRD